MKASTIIGGASLALNLVLLGVLAVGTLDRSAPAVPPAPAASAVAADQKNSAPPARAWEGLGSTDLAATRDRLQAEGFPPSAIRAILAAQIREQFAARRKAIDASLANQPFWKGFSVDPQIQAQLRALAKEEQQALKNLLGPDPVNSLAARLRREFPDLPGEKVDQIAAMRERYDEQRQDIYGLGRGTPTPSEREKVRALEKSMHQELATLLTPAELENYDLRTSNTANQLRYTLSSFDATEAEFRALFRLQQAYDDQHSYQPGSTPEQMRQRNEAQKKLNDDIAAALGASRYVEYQRATDYNYRQASQLVARLNLAPETAITLHGVQKEFEERRSALYRNATPETRQNLTPQLTALQQEATTRVTTVLGGNTTAVNAYKQYGGSWLGNLAPRLTPPSPPSAPAPKK